MKNNWILLLILIFICAFMSIYRDSSSSQSFLEEPFTTTPSTTRDFSIFFNYFASFFMTQTELSNIVQTDKVKMFNISETFMDLYCGDGTCAFDTVRLTNMSIKDPYLAKDCYIINGILDGIEENSNIRIFENFYYLHKMCCPINISSVQSAGIANSYILSIELTPVIYYMMLTRPIFIEFEKYGLCKMDYNSSFELPFVKNRVINLQVTYDREQAKTLKMFDVNVRTTKLTAVSYHLTHNPYKNNGYGTTTNQSNTMNFCFILDNTHFTSPDILNVPFTHATNAPTNRITNVRVRKNTSTSVLEVEISANTNTINSIVINTGFNPTQYSVSSHLVLAFCFDKVIILTLGKNANQSCESKLIVKQLISSSTQLYVNVNKSQLPITITSKYNTVCPPTSIPNLAHVALKLGYSFS